MNLAKWKVLLLCFLVLGCKPKASQLASLENFAAGRKLRDNECQASPGKRDANQDLIGRIKIEPAGAPNAPVVREVLTAVPRGLLSFFVASKGVVHLHADAQTQCYEQMAKAIGLKAIHATKDAGEKLEACALQGMRAGAPGGAEDGTWETLPPLDIYVQDQPAMIRHHLLKQFGMTFFVHLNQLGSKSTAKGVRFLPGSKPRPDIELAVQQLAHAYLMDVDRSKIFEVNVLDRYLGAGAGGILHKSMLGGVQTTVPPIEMRIESYLYGRLPNVSKAELTVRAGAFRSLAAIEAFDSYYCNQFGAYDEKSMDRLLERKFANFDEVTAILKAQKNTAAVFRDLFPRTYMVFRAKILPLLRELPVPKKKQKSAGLALADERPKGMQQSDQYDAASRSMNEGWRYDYLRLRAKQDVGGLVAGQAMQIQMAYDRAMPQVNAQLDKIEDYNTRAKILSIAAQNGTPQSRAELVKFLGPGQPASDQRQFILKPSDSMNAFKIPSFDSSTPPSGRDAFFDGLTRNGFTRQEQELVARGIINGDLSENDIRSLNNLTDATRRQTQVAADEIRTTLEPVWDKHAKISREWKPYVLDTALPQLDQLSMDPSNPDSTEAILKRMDSADEKTPYIAAGLTPRILGQLRSGDTPGLYDRKTTENILDSIDIMGPRTDLTPDQMLQRRREGDLFPEARYAMGDVVNTIGTVPVRNNAYEIVHEGREEQRQADKEVIYAAQDAIGVVPVVGDVLGDGSKMVYASYNTFVNGDDDWDKIAESGIAFAPVVGNGVAVYKGAKASGKSMTTAARTALGQAANAPISSSLIAQGTSMGVGFTQPISTMQTWMANNPNASDADYAAEQRRQFQQQFGKAPIGSSPEQIEFEASTEAARRDYEAASQMVVPSQEFGPSGSTVPPTTQQAPLDDADLFP